MDKSEDQKESAIHDIEFKQQSVAQTMPILQSQQNDTEGIKFELPDRKIFGFKQNLFVKSISWKFS